jgi:hypothetical protein
MDALAISSAPADAQAKLVSMAYSGSGCPQGSASKEYDAQINSGRWFFDGISAQIGPNVPISKSTQNCEVQLSIQTAPGWRFVVKGKNAGTTSMTARVNLQDGVVASSITTYNVAGVNSQVSHCNTRIKQCLTVCRAQSDTTIPDQGMVKHLSRTPHQDQRILSPTAGEGY